jgi:hypothetical protein
VGERHATVAEREWTSSMLYGEEPSAGPLAASTQATSPTPPDGNEDDSAAVDLDPPVEDCEASTARMPVDANAGAKRVAVILALVLLCAMGVIVGALHAFQAPAADPPAERVARAPMAAVAPSAPAVGAPIPSDRDQAVTFTASADCPAGSTSAQTLTDTTHDSAWVCVRGPADAAVDGQVLHVDFGASRVLTVVSVTPGWVAKTAGGQDEWLQHRVVSRLQYIFNDDDHTIVTQDTGNAHGPVTLPLPRPVLASQVTVIVLQTTRPPASPLPSADLTTADTSGFPDPGSVQTDLPTPGAQTDDPVDATFAMSALQFFGHPPR